MFAILKFTLVGLFVIGYVLPNHYHPWLAFHNEFPFFLASALVPFMLSAMPLARIANSHIKTIIGLTAVFLLLFLLQSTPMRSTHIAVFLFYSWLLVAFFLAGWSLTDNDPKLVSETIVAPALLISSLISCYLILDQWLRLSNGFHIADIGTGSRPFANLAQPNNTATLLLFGMAAALYLRALGHIGKTGIGSITIVHVFCISLTQSRTAYIGVAILAIMGLIQIRKKFTSSGNFGYSLFLATMPLGLFIFAATLPYINDLLLLSNAGVGDRGALSPQRLIIWTQSIHAVFERPLLGYGFHNVSEALVSISNSHNSSVYTEYAHNALLDLAIWFGLPISIFLFGSLLYWLYDRFSLHSSKEEYFGLTLILIFSVHSMLELPHAYAYFLVPVALMAGVIDHRQSRRKGLLTLSKSHLILSGALGLILCFIVFNEYLKIEQAHRDMRFATARIGPPQPFQFRNESLFFPELTEYIRFARSEAREGMSPEELDWMRRVAHNKAFSPSLSRYALALALNNRPEAAAVELTRLRSLHGIQRYEEVRSEWMGLALRYPQLAKVLFPE